jgi:CBS domain-containing protein
MDTVRDVMTRSVLSVRPDTPLKDVARLLIENRISGLPVVDDAGQVVGVVSEGDLLVKEQSKDAFRHRPLARLFGESTETRMLLSKAEARTAGDAMTSPAITVDAARQVGEAAATMIERKVNRLPVTDDGRLVGIVTRADVIRTFVRTDAELAESIRQDVLLRALWEDPDTFSVGVENGVATVRGRVERRSSVGIIERMVEMLPGIVGVTMDVSWAMDDRNLKSPPHDYISPKSPS